jgi:hypothetical protein
MMRAADRIGRGPSNKKANAVTTWRGPLQAATKKADVLAVIAVVAIDVMLAVAVVEFAAVAVLSVVLAVAVVVPLTLPAAVAEVVPVSDDFQFRAPAVAIVATCSLGPRPDPEVGPSPRGIPYSYSLAIFIPIVRFLIVRFLDLVDSKLVMLDGRKLAALIHLHNDLFGFILIVCIHNFHAPAIKGIRHTILVYSSAHFAPSSCPA